MKRYKILAICNPLPDENGEFVLFADACEAMQNAIMFAAKHAEDIENDVDDFGDLKHLLDMIPRKETIN